MTFRLLLLYSETGSYKPEIPALLELAREVAEESNVPLTVRTRRELAQEEEATIEDQIRVIPPQRRGRIVTSGGFMLPLSGSKRLNLTNTPILLLFEEERLHSVFPHKLGARHVTVKEALEKMSSEGIPFSDGTAGLAEKSIAQLLWDDPSILEDGMRRKDVEVDVDTGRADLLLEDSEHITVVVEIETYANERAVAQLQRLGGGVRATLPPEARQIRKALVCRGFDSNILPSCRESSIEVYRLEFERKL